MSVIIQGKRLADFRGILKLSERPISLRFTLVNLQYGNHSANDEQPDEYDY